MKSHAPSRNRKSRLLLSAPFAAIAGFAPASAWALVVPAPAAQETCPVAMEAVATPLAVQPSKTEAILGGARSRLEELRAQQAAPTTPQPMESTAMLAPAAGPTTAPLLPCAAMAFAKLPTFDTPTETDPQKRAIQFVTRLAAVSIARQPQVQPGLVLAPVDVSKPNVFGSIALTVGRTPLDSKWQRAQSAALPGRSGPWGSLVSEARRADHSAKIDMVNSWVNRRISFVDDIVRFRTADRWATAAETLRAGQGDCEDYAIAKMKLLEAAGIARSDMFLVIAKDLVRRADHALLVVRNGDRLVVLDNNTDRIVDAAAIRDYRPVMSYSAGKAWIHGYATQPATVERAPIRIAALGG